MIDPEEEIYHQEIEAGTKEEVYQAEGTEDTPDGGAIIQMGPDEPESEGQIRKFYDNLIDLIPLTELSKLSQDLVEKIERDKKSRTRRDENYAEAIRRTGLSDDAPGGASFAGASKVVHPMLTEACVDFASRVMPELLPSDGPVKSFVPGKNPPKSRLDKADRKKDYMNWQFTVQMPEIRSQIEQLLTQLPLGGSQYMRIVWDEEKNRAVPVYAPIDSVYLPYSATSFQSAERRTFAEDITEQELQSRIDSGMYDKDTSVLLAAEPEQSASEIASDNVEGRDNSDALLDDGLRRLYHVEASIDLSVPDDKGPCQYLVTLDDNSGDILRIIRNWDKEDETKERMDWGVEFQFIPWRGAYSIGLGQMIGSLSGAATGALRALLDSAHINNIPTLLRLKGTNLSGQSKELGIGEITEVEGGMQTDDIRKLMMAVPYNQPSPVLQQLLGFLTDAGKGVVRTTFEKLYDSNSHNMPVGTTLALIEEGQKVMSAIHLRLYHSMTQMIRILHRINRMYLTDEEVNNELGEMLAYRADFQLPLDVVPVADPHIFSDVQRMSQLEVVSQRAKANPGLYNLRKVEQRLLERTKIPNPDELLVPEMVPTPKNAIIENADMALGKPVAAFPDQDHIAHLSAHHDFMMNPVLGQLPIIAPKFLPACIEHIKEHIVLWYMDESFEMLRKSANVSQDEMNQIIAHDDPDTRKVLDDSLSVVSTKVSQASVKQFEGLPKVIADAMQIMQSMAPAPQLDPNLKAQLEQKTQSDQMKAQSEQAKVQERHASGQMKTQADMAKAQMQNAQKGQVIQFDREKMQSDQMADFRKLTSDEQAIKFKEAQANLRFQEQLLHDMKELQIIEEHKDDRLAVDHALKDKINQDDNRAALAVAAAEIETKSNISVGGIDPNVAP